MNATGARRQPTSLELASNEFDEDVEEIPEPLVGYYFMG